VAQHALVGRGVELARLADLARGAAAGRGGLVLIEGEPGIGKTVLLQAALGDAADLLPRRVTGTAEEFDQRLPFATVGSCLEPLEASDHRVAEVLAWIRDGSGEHPVIESILALIEEWCSACPMALAVDDLHWADPASILLLHRLGRVADQLPLLLAGVIRGGTSRPDVDALTRSWSRHRAAQIVLGPLPDPAVTQLVASLAGGEPGPVLRDLIDATAGNPLYINELVGALAQEMQLHTEGVGVDIKPGPDRRAVPPTLRVAVIRRLEFLSAGTRELLQVAALLGTAFSVADVAAVLDRPVTSMLGSVREAIDAGVLTELPDRLAFRHPLVRTVLDDELPVSAQQALHLQVAQALTTRTSPERVAEHLLAAGPAAGPLLPWLAGNADELAARTPELAIELFSRVLDTTVPLAETARQLRAALATALLRSGRADRAEQVARSALTVPVGPRAEAALRWTLASACFSQAAFDRAVAEIGTALADGRLTQGEEARFRGLEAQCRIPLGQHTVASTAWRDSISAVQASGDTEACAYVMAGAAAAFLWDGQVDEALGYADASVGATEALSPRAAGQLAPHLFRGVCLTELDRDAEAGQAFEDALRLAERGIGTDYLGWRSNAVARLRFYQGRWDEALAEAQAGLDLPDPLSMARHLHAMIALVAVHRRDRAALAEQLPFLQTPPQAFGHAPSPVPLIRRHSAHVPDWALAQAAYADGRTAEAAAILGATWDGDRTEDPLRFLRHYLVPDLVGFSLAGDDPAAAGRVADRIGRYAAQRSAPGLRRSVRHARALADQDGNGLAAVAEEYAEADRALFAAQAREQAAPLLAAAGRVPEARDALLSAVAAYESMEASWDLARVYTLLRTLGVRRGARGPRRRPKFGWDALTDAEKVVADLVAEGLSNPAIAARLYLSRRTVQFHVSSILGKLGAASRVELATMVIRHDAAPG
jgi:DNA-binding NarL/FixJ family response regulator